jgi:hypothetical protein
MLRWLGLIQLDLYTLMPLDCLFRANFHTTLLMRTLIPLGIMGSLAAFGAHAFHKAAKKNKEAKKQSAVSWAWLGNLLINTTFALLFLVYPSVCSAIFSTFQCKPLDDGSRMLRVDLLIDCNSSAHQGMTAYAIVMVGVYALGAPGLYGYLLLKRFGKPLYRIKAIEARHLYLTAHAKAKDEYDQYEKVTGEKRALTSATSDSVAAEVKELQVEEASLRAELPSFIRSLSGNGYSKSCFYFEIVECFRKLLIVCVPVIFEVGSQHQRFFALLVTFGSTCAYAIFMPYAELKSNYYALMAQAVIFFNLISSLAQPLGVGMDAALSALVIGFTVLPFFLSMPARPTKLFSKRAKPKTTRSVDEAIKV